MQQGTHGPSGVPNVPSPFPSMILRPPPVVNTRSVMPSPLKSAAWRLDAPYSASLTVVGPDRNVPSPLPSRISIPDLLATIVPATSGIPSPLKSPTTKFPPLGPMQAIAFPAFAHPVAGTEGKLVGNVPSLLPSSTYNAPLQINRSGIPSPFKSARAS